MASRSAWRLPYIHPIFFSGAFRSRKLFKTRCRWFTIPDLPSGGQSFEVHDGRKFQSIVYKKEMAGNKLGAFVVTKKLGQKKKVQKKRR